MCGIFGIISNKPVVNYDLKLLAKYAEQRGRDSSGLFFFNYDKYSIIRSPQALMSLLEAVTTKFSACVMGHSRLITNGLADNQPVYRDGVCVIHNGIVVNHDALWEQISKNRLQEIDTEIIAAIADVE